MGLDLYVRSIHFSYRLAEIWRLPPGSPFTANLSGFLRGEVGCEKCQLQQLLSSPLFGVTLWILAVSIDPAKAGDWFGCSGLLGLLAWGREGMAQGTTGVVFTH